MNIEVTRGNIDLPSQGSEAITVHWRAVFAGIFVSMLVYLTLFSLGMGLGAGQIKEVLNGEGSAQSIGLGATIWLMVSVLIALFVGSFASSRMSGIIATRVGYMQGAVIAALFFTLMITQLGMALGFVGTGLGVLSNTLTQTSGSIANNPIVTNFIQDTMSDVEFDTSPSEFVAGVLNRMMRGDREAAVGYITRETGVSSEDARARYETIRGRVQQLTEAIAQRSSELTRQVGWISFIAMVLGTGFAMLGGGMGALMNLRKPFGALDERATRDFAQPAYAN